ncbi:phosphoribosylamine--glycine ligase [Brachyspira hyodysenteriae]|uniref:phosphoribosylamine--glycine ligase n=1 Tax=Brachyspira hyodysenteriae TaxID=159 RepID=UPI00063D8BA1|nr:phosphoribosylamine--glycine ligase [Brachyspira hyodysenteriae]KLI14386.1 phosphoribosylamine--glycine ligase [Brachyspira hyodysenteriae]KLI32343.1 phosphoribosylamine--glycine ligase [Brachyspira hyodysenteriae]MBT8720573.1 phosphoribosylamine--glycine ligase [Brachyspira hyodysenteriae]MBT8730741.1 phosphoribosylamine--glycine ligase [Brachyspira hyodysenteriae]MBT8733189.1 phosphoribosylamine--glycine ligase [Brachyspira hyodysenteriae]
MKILVIGSGAREHAICNNLLKNEKVSKVYCVPGNAGTAREKNCENVKISTIDEILNFAKKENIDLTIVGSEEMLVYGIVDKFEENGLKIFGPNKQAAILEGSKAYAKDFMKKYGVKTAEYELFTDYNKANEYLDKCSYPIVIKASGLALGKGVLICQDKQEAKNALEDIMVKKIFKDAGDEVVIEEFLEGVEASILSVTDSNVIIPFISAKDHKKVGDNDTGNNTGGMGVISPNPYYTKEVEELFIKDILEPTLKGIKAEKMSFAGIIFFGLMITKKGVYLLEYNVRMGDPETQAVLQLLETDYLSIIESAMKRELSNLNIKWKDKHACCVVMASGGYPASYNKGYKIEGIDKINGQCFIAGAKLDENGNIITDGGRVLNVVNIADSLEEARKLSYSDIEKIDFKDKYYRKDIGLIK